MSDLAPPKWRWEDHPDVCLSDYCANGDCRRCRGTFIDDSEPADDSLVCGHPCHNLEKQT